MVAHLNYTDTLLVDGTSTGKDAAAVDVLLSWTGN